MRGRSPRRALGDISSTISIRTTLRQRPRCSRLSSRPGIQHAGVADRPILDLSNEKPILNEGRCSRFEAPRLGLIDEHEFVVHPRLAGHGPTLFAGLSKHHGALVLQFSGAAGLAPRMTYAMGGRTPLIIAVVLGGRS